MTTVCNNNIVVPKLTNMGTVTSHRMCGSGWKFIPQHEFHLTSMAVAKYVPCVYTYNNITVLKLRNLIFNGMHGPVLVNSILPC